MSTPPELRRRPGRPPSSTARRIAASFGRFWWEFLVGDTPELLAGAVVAVVAAALLAHNGAARGVTLAALPVLVIALLATTLWRATRAPGGRRR